MFCFSLLCLCIWVVRGFVKTKSCTRDSTSATGMIIVTSTDNWWPYARLNEAYVISNESILLSLMDETGTHFSVTLVLPVRSHQVGSILNAFFFLILGPSSLLDMGETGTAPSSYLTFHRHWYTHAYTNMHTYTDTQTQTHTCIQTRIQLTVTSRRKTVSRRVWSELRWVISWEYQIL